MNASNSQSSPSQKEKFSYISAINFLLVDVDFNTLDHNKAMNAVIPPAIATKPTTSFNFIPLAREIA